MVSYSPFAGIFRLLPLLVGGVFILVAVILLVLLVQNAARWQKNNRSPVLTVEAAVVAKRQALHHMRAANHMHATASNRYYATFEVESGDRMELPLPAEEYGLLAEGDRGLLTFQGTRFLGFSRHRAS